MNSAADSALETTLNSAEWHARIELRGQVAGAGFLVTSSTVPTCAHVVRDGEGPTVTFPLVVTDHARRKASTRHVGLARNATTGRQLREAGCETTVTSLAPLLDAARSL